MLFVLLVLVFVGISGTRGLIGFNPPGYNASLGSSTVSFLCSASVPTTLFFSIGGLNIDAITGATRNIRINNLNRTSARLTIEPLLINNNTVINCFGLAQMEEADVLLLVQGPLSAPPDPVIISSSPGLQQLSWSAPFTIDLTDQDPDILGYRVCYSMLSSTYPAECSVTNMLTYSFLNVSLPLNFSISAINPAGEGAASSVTYSSCTTETINSFQGIEVFLSQENFTLSATVHTSPQTQCYDAYQFVVQGSKSSFTSPVLIPTRVDRQLQSIEIRHKFVQLRTDTIYTAKLTAINSEGEKVVANSVPFGTYDLQGVSVEVVGAGAVKMTCSFLTYSMARGCHLTVCNNRIGSSSRCFVVIANRNSNSSTAVAEFTSLSEEIYTIIFIEVVEQDQELTAISDLIIFNLQPFTVTGVATHATEVMTHATEKTFSDSNILVTTAVNPENRKNKATIVATPHPETILYFHIFWLIQHST